MTHAYYRAEKFGENILLVASEEGDGGDGGDDVVGDAGHDDRNAWTCLCVIFSRTDTGLLFYAAINFTAEPSIQS